MSSYSGVEMYLINIEKNLNEIRDVNKSLNGKMFFTEYEEKMEEFKKKFSNFEEEIEKLDFFVLLLVKIVEEGN